MVEGNSQQLIAVAKSLRRQEGSIPRRPHFIVGRFQRHPPWPILWPDIRRKVLRGRAIQGKWTPNEIIGHLTDIEWVYGYRLRLILCEDEPAILGFRQDAWVACATMNASRPNLSKYFGRWAYSIWSVWRRMSPEDLQHSGQHNERGAESLAVMLQLLAGHDLSHLHQISRYIQALESRG
jgi:hypothetical protein